MMQDLLTPHIDKRIETIPKPCPRHFAVLLDATSENPDGSDYRTSKERFLDESMPNPYELGGDRLEFEKMDGDRVGCGKRKSFPRNKDKVEESCGPSLALYDSQNESSDIPMEKTHAIFLPY